MLRDVVRLLLDCGLRPEECYGLRWEHVRDDALHIPVGKTANARRSIPLPNRWPAQPPFDKAVNDLLLDVSVS